jgi:hypothetical protein
LLAAESVAERNPLTVSGGERELPDLLPRQVEVLADAARRGSVREALPELPHRVP